MKNQEMDKTVEIVEKKRVYDGFFKMDRFTIGDFKVTALNHRMSGAPGYEFWGPSVDGPAVRDLLMEAGKAFGLTQIGGAIYPVTAVESGWLGGTVPAIYTGEEMKPYREWLSSDAPEAQGSLGGSYCSTDIKEYYATPYDLGYGFMVKFDHDFIGRDALEKISSQPKRKKVRLYWNHEDVKEVITSTLNEGASYKHLNVPVGNYSMFSQDEVLLMENM